MNDSKSAKFDLRTLQRDDDNLPSLAALQSGDKAPSLVDIQSDRPELPSLKSFQSDENVSYDKQQEGSRAVQSRHRQRGTLLIMRSHRSLEETNTEAAGEKTKTTLQMMNTHKSMEQPNP